MITAFLEFINNVYAAGWLPKRIKEHFFQYTFNILIAIGLLYGYLGFDNYEAQVVQEGIVLKNLGKECNNSDEVGRKCFALYGKTSKKSLQSMLQVADYEKNKYIELTFHRMYTQRSLYNSWTKGADLSYPDLILDEDNYGAPKYIAPIKLERYNLGKILMVSSNDEKGVCGSFSTDLLVRMGLYNIHGFLLSLNADIYNVTYCYDDYRITLLTQVRGHKSVSYDPESRYGCKTNDCITEVRFAHEERKKIFNRHPF